MGILARFSKLLAKDKYQDTNYLSLVLTLDRVAALIWTFVDGQVRELGFGQKATNSVDLLLHQTAVAIDTAGEAAKVDFGRTVFGISASWLEDGELSQKSARILKKLADELELDPQAFVPIAVGIIHFLKIEKFPAPQVIAIGLFTKSPKEPFCEIHLIDKNQVVATKTTNLPVSVAKIQSLVRELADKEQLPAHVIIYGIEEKDKLAQELTGANWQDHFIQEPKFDFMTDRDLVRSIAYAQAADLLGHEPVGQGAPASPEQQPSGAAPLPQTLPSAKPAKATDELGFVEGEDILLLGKRETDTSATPEESYAIEVGDQPDQTAVSPQAPKSNLQKNLRSLITSLVSLSFSPKKIAIIILTIAVLVLLASFAAGQYLTRAEVKIKVQGKPHQAEFEATVKSLTESSPQSQIPGQILSAQAQGNQKAVTTGNKKIGEPARGEVAILNWTTSAKTFSQGTAIITKDGLKFTLDTDAEVASRSAATPGKNKAAVTAAEVGPNSNLPQGTDFTFVNFDEISYSASSETALSGGSEKQVTVVTQEDTTRLEKSLTETTTTRARDDLKNKASGKLLLDEAITTKIRKISFDKKLGEEASLLTLDMEVEAQAIVFDQNDLKKLLAETTNSSLDPQVSALPDKIQIQRILGRRQNSTLTLTGEFQTSLVPRFSEEDLINQIAGKGQKNAREIVKQIAGVVDVQISYSPNLLVATSLPRDKTKITITIDI